MKTYQSRQKDYRREYDKKYSLENRLERNARAKAWRLAHLEQDKITHQKYNAALRDEMFIAYGQCCACCGETTKEFLSIDHIRRDGQQHRKSTGGNGVSFLSALRKLGWPKDGLRILCMNCNWATRYGHQCPHERGRGNVIPLQAISANGPTQVQSA